MRRAGRFFFAGALAAAVFAAGADAATPVETPSLQALVEAGKLPPVAARLPETPAVVVLNTDGRTMGRHGGSMRMLMAKPKDVRMMMVYGYARLVAYTPDLRTVADILERFEVKEGRQFTFYLRRGHKWSDGHPFTAEDFRYYWEDVVGSKELSPIGPTKVLLVDGEAPTFEIINATTVRYTWRRPNPYFLPALAGPSPLFIYRPAHYLKRFHTRYVDADKMAEMVKAAKKRNWVGLHFQKDRQYRSDNPDLPTLQPWRNTVFPPSDHFIFERNPFYHRVDMAGRQLPYIDRVIVDIGSNKIIPAKTGAGETDLQARYLRFDNYTFLKESEQRNNFSVRLWRTVKGAQLALYPNLNTEDPVWRKLLRDVRFRRALSLAIDRHEINQVVYFGLAREGNNTILPASPLYRETYRTTWAEFDLAGANALLDELGLSERDDRGIRLLPDGRPLDVIVDTAGESTEETDVLELIHDSWLKAGIKLFPRPAQREIFRKRIFAGLTVMSVWSGITNGIPTAGMSPEELVPTSQQQLQWPKWGQYEETSGRAGEAVDMPVARELLRLNDAWRRAGDDTEAAKVWHRILTIQSQQVFTIGIINGTLQPVVVNNRLRNVPEKGFYNWHPGAYFGVFKPDTFWMAAN